MRILSHVHPLSCIWHVRTQVAFLEAVEESERSGARCPFYLGKVPLLTLALTLGKVPLRRTLALTPTPTLTLTLRCRCARSYPSSLS
jgi:hypothetical protein